MPTIILASSSPYRAQLLHRIVSRFDTDSPDIDERARADESGKALAARLAAEKASAVARRHRGSVIIAADQVALLQADTAKERVLGKPGDFAHAREQLLACSGQRVAFHSACCVLNGHTNRIDHFHDTVTVTYKTLAPETVESYLRQEQPFDCAGSIKTEGLGVALLAHIDGADPGTLLGLPLIPLVRALENNNISII
ncbi:MAG: septum formation protein Maf [Gammaproteobacteria bacterium]|nr:septum formation protein Maf [Gammaproteobacteria bacterium]MBT8151267.1 septum formation protein Maf [Gammaproteobacteria bacterium]NND38748.1 septum formation protein Maf [Pseudomonadales bacterium]NNL11132.1 septum formation protein Maf [Pseudomonadales bacterium]NNM12212.1 septum formation protein Maf [Pseudomonadales bacterium]